MDEITRDITGDPGMDKVIRDLEADGSVRVVSATETIDLTPEWPNTLRWTATVVAQHGFERYAYAPIASLLEMAVKVYQDNPSKFKSIVEELRLKDGHRKLAAEIVVGPETTPYGPILVHYHTPTEDWNPIVCLYCGKEIEKSGEGWVLKA